jgi:anti-sigma factor RsiW
MTWDHRRVEELLAARAVDGLDPEDAALAERALIEHVPGCQRCRESLDAYALVAGDLALVADATVPPDTLEARLRRSIRRRRRLRGAGWAAAGVAVVVAVAMAGWNTVLASRLSETEQEQASLTKAFISAGHPDGSVVPLTGPGPERATMVYVDGQDEMYVIATSLRDTDGVYSVWLLGRQKAWSPGTLEPHHGVAFLVVHTDPERWGLVMVTEESDPDVPAPTSSPLVSATVQ